MLGVDFGYIVHVAQIYTPETGHVIMPVQMFVNMDGRLRGLQFNQVATRVFHDCGGDRASTSWALHGLDL